VLLHGVFFGREAWSPVVDVLARDCRVLTVDLPRHGDLRNEEFTLNGASDWVSSAMDAAGLQSATLVGWSLGGFVAMRLAASEPGRVSGLILTGATIAPPIVLTRPGRLFARLASYGPTSLMNAILLAIVRLVFGRRSAAVLRGASPGARQGMAALARLPAAGYLRLLGSFAGPVLLLNGRNDHLARHWEQLFLRTAQHGSLKILTADGHLSPIVAPEEFATEVLRFVRAEAEVGDESAPDVVASAL